MDGVFSAAATARENVAGLIRAQHSGLCSGEPVGISYPGVPSVASVLREIGVGGESHMTEDDWFMACEAVGV